MSNPQLQIAGIPVTIAFEDLGDRAVVEMAPDQAGLQATVIFKCAWAQRLNVIKGLLGYVTPNGASIVRVPPVFYPDLPKLYCKSVGEVKAIKPRVRSTGDGWFDAAYALITANFGAPVWQLDDAADLSGKLWTTTRTRTSAEVFIPPVGAYYFETTGKPVPEANVGIMRPKIEISMTRHWLPYMPLAEAAAAIGHVNSGTLTLGNFTFAAETLLFAGMSTQPAADTIGNVIQEVEYCLLGNMDGISWNKFFSPAGTWDYINTAAGGGGSRPFPTSNWYPTLP